MPGMPSSWSELASFPAASAETTRTQKVIALGIKRLKVCVIKAFKKNIFDENFKDVLFDKQRYV